MDRLLIRFFVATSVAAMAIVPQASIRAADQKLPALIPRARQLDPQWQPKSPHAGGKPLTVEQLRARYEADRKQAQVEIHVKQKEFDKAYAVCEQIIAAYRSVGLYEGEQQFFWTVFLGRLDLERNKFDEAEALFHQALELADGKLGPKSAEAALVRHHLGRFYLEHKRDLARSHALLLESTAMFRDLGDAHTFDLCATLDWLACCEFARDHIPEALAYYRESCDRRRERAGLANVDQAFGLRDLGKLYLLTNDHAAARRCFDESAELFEKLQGADSAETTASRELALNSAKASSRKLPDARLEQERKSLLERLDRAEAAKKPREMLPLAIRLEAILRAEFGDEDEDVLYMSLIVAMALRDCDDSTAAAAKFRQVLTTLDGWPEAPPKLRAGAVMHLAALELDAQHYAEAKVLLRATLEVYDAAKSDTLQRGTILQQLALSEIAGSEFAAALEHLEGWSALRADIEKEALRQHLEIAVVLVLLCSEEPSLRTRCTALHAKILKRAEDAFGANDILLADILPYAAMLEYRNGDSAAIRTIERARDLNRKLREPNHPSPAKADLMLAKFCRAFGQLDRARTIFEAQLATARKESAHEDAYTLLFQLAGIDAYQDRRDAALRRYREATELVAKVEGTDSETFAAGRMTWEAYEAGEIPSLAAADNPDAFTFRNIFSGGDENERDKKGDGPEWHQVSRRLFGGRGSALPSLHCRLGSRGSLRRTERVVITFVRRRLCSASSAARSSGCSGVGRRSWMTRRFAGPASKRVTHGAIGSSIRSPR